MQHCALKHQPPNYLAHKPPQNIKWAYQTSLCNLAAVKHTLTDGWRKLFKIFERRQQQPWCVFLKIPVWTSPSRCGEPWLNCTIETWALTFLPMRSSICTVLWLRPRNKEMKRKTHLILLLKPANIDSKNLVIKVRFTVCYYIHHFSASPIGCKTDSWPCQLYVRHYRLQERGRKRNDSFLILDQAANAER